MSNERTPHAKVSEHSSLPLHEISPEALNQEIDPAIPRVFGMFRGPSQEQRTVYTRHIGSLEHLLAAAATRKAEKGERIHEQSFSGAERIIEIFGHARASRELPSGKEITRRPHLVITGGFVRDTLLGSAPKDIDFATNLTYEETERLINEALGEDIAAGRVRFKRTGELFPVMRVKFDNGGEYEIATFREEEGVTDGRRPEKMQTVRYAGVDADRRDFTINALFYNPLSGNVIDYVGGLKDIDARVLRFVGNPRERIAEDQTRMLRYIRFLEKTGCNEDPEAKSAIREQGADVLRRPAEVITEELNRMFALGHVGTTLERLRDYGLLEYILPEVADLDACEQGPPYHMEGDVFRHTVLVANGLPEHARMELAWAAILHDIGKPDTRSEDLGKDGSPVVHFLEHEHASVRKVREIMASDNGKKRFAFSNQSADTIVKLIENHIKIFSFADMRRGNAEAFLKDTGEYWDDLYALAIADTRASHGSNPALDTEREENLQRVYARAQEIFAFWEQAKDAINEITALINGNLIKERYGAIHGIALIGPRQKIIGVIKNAAQAKIREERILDPDKARETLDSVIRGFPPET